MFKKGSAMLEQCHLSQRRSKGLPGRRQYRPPSYGVAQEGLHPRQKFKVLGNFEPCTSGGRSLTSLILSRTADKDVSSAATGRVSWAPSRRQVA